MSTDIISQKVSLREKLGYSLGDAAANLVFQMMVIFQLKFYTDVFGLDGTMAGTVMMIGSMAALLIDPTVGILADRTQTRWGKYRPWLLWTALPFCVFYILAFYNPGIEEKGLVALYATISYVLLMAVYSFNNVPYSSLGGVMTSDIRERTSITTIRFIAVTIAQFVVQGLTLPLVDHFGEEQSQSLAHGWVCTISLFACIAFVFFMVSFAVSRERIQPSPSQKNSLYGDVKSTVSDIAWTTMFLLTFALFISLSMWGSAMSFFFQYDIDQQALFKFLLRYGVVDSPDDAYSTGFSLFNMMGAIIQFIGVIALSRYLANKYGKRSVFIVCLSLTAIFTALFYLPNPKDIGLLFGLNFVRSLVYAPTVPLLWAMIADVADHIEYVSGRRATAFCFSGITVALKFGLGIGGAITGAILSYFGYVSGAGVVQNDSAVQGIRLVASIMPALLMAIGVMALFFYPIGKRYNENMQAELSMQRKQEAGIDDDDDFSID